MKMYAVMNGDHCMYGSAGSLSDAKEILERATISGGFPPYRIVTIEDYEPEKAESGEDEILEVSGFSKPRTRAEWRSVLAGKERKLAPKISAANRIRKAIGGNPAWARTQPEVDPEDELISVFGNRKPLARKVWRKTAEELIAEANAIRKAIGEPEVSDE